MSLNTLEKLKSVQQRLFYLEHLRDNNAKKNANLGNLNPHNIIFNKFNSNNPEQYKAQALLLDDNGYESEVDEKRIMHKIENNIPQNIQRILEKFEKNEQNIKNKQSDLQKLHLDIQDIKEVQKYFDQELEKTQKIIGSLKID